ncbi:uncharacterized protein ACRADG_002609 [Cochliomyia hominivorax]
MLFSLKLLFSLIWLSASWAEFGPPTPHSDCPILDDINHAVMLPYPADCSKYYTCLNGYAYLQQCPNNLHWSQLTYRCDYPAVAKCQSTSTEIPIPPKPTTPNLVATFTGEISYQLHANECTKFYKCEVMSCPAFYYWNSLIEKCDFPHNVHCPFQPGQLTASTDVEAKPIVSDIFTQLYPNDCGKYYQCQTLSCPNSYHWNVHLQKCDLPQLAQCPYQEQLPAVVDTSTAMIPTAFTAPPTPVVTSASNAVTDNICPECVQLCDGFLHHYLPHPNDCHKFIQCNGWSFIHTCPDNLFWNAKLNTCDRICVAK